MDKKPLLRERLLEPWIGKKCAEIIRHEYSWQFSFPPAGGVNVSSLWRIILDNRVVLCSLDDGQRFGLTKHMDVAQSAWEIIFGKIVLSASVNENGGLVVRFENGATLQILINSGGYESWNAASWSDEIKRNIVATGGGELAVFEQ
jgi:hypothetical protein